MFRPQPKSGTKPKKLKTPLKRTPLKKGKKPTGEKAVFWQISEDRMINGVWYCFVTGTRLEYLSATSFCHVLSKSATKYPKFKLKPENIVLVQDWIHYSWDHTPRSGLKHKMWEKMFNLENQLKEEYKKL